MSENRIRSFAQWASQAPINEPFWKGLIRSAIMGVAIGTSMGIAAYGLTILTFGIKCR